MSFKTQPISELLDRLCIERNKVFVLNDRIGLYTNIPKTDRMIKEINNWDYAKGCAENKIKVVKEELAEIFAKILGIELDASFTLSNMFDDLCAAVNTVSKYENMKREEHKRGVDKRDDRISDWDNISRDACETRSRIKNEIDKLLKTMLGDKYDYLEEGRTM